MNKIKIIIFSLLIPNLAWASDFSGLFFILYFVLMIPPTVFALIIWGLNKKSGLTRRIKYLMALPFFIILTPVPWGPENIPWPSAAVILAGDIKDKGLATEFNFCNCIDLVGFY